MQLIEKIKPQGFNTDIHPESVELGNEGNRRVINPVVDSLNKHYFTSEVNDGERCQNVKGNVLKANSLPAGTNVCIGSYEDKINNILIFWNYNSNGNHGVYAYSPETDSISILIQRTGLNFQNDRRYLVTGAGVVGKLLYWSDGYNQQRVINITRAYTYGSTSLSDIDVLKIGPYTRPTVGANASASKNAEYDRNVDASIPSNSITDKSYQFAYRYRFLDNEYSVISPISSLSQADWEPDPFNGKRNQVRIRIDATQLPTLPQFFVKSIDVLVREGNSTSWSIFKTFDAGAGAIDTYFTGSEALIKVDQVTTGKLFESVPNTSKALAVHRNRLFLSTDVEGFDVNSSMTIGVTETPFTWLGTTTLLPTLGIPVITMTYGSKTLSMNTPLALVAGENVELQVSTFGFMRGVVTACVGASVTIYFNYVSANYGLTPLSIGAAYTLKQYHVSFQSPGVLNQNGDWSLAYWKTNATHYFGIAVWDEQMRSMGIVGKQKVTISSGLPDPSLPNQGILACAKDITIDVTLTGNFVASPKVKYISLCATEDQFYLVYQQVIVKVLFYVGEYVTGASIHAGQFVMNNRLYTRTPQNGGFNSLFLLLPLNVAISPDDTFYVRLLAVPGLLNWTGKVNKVQAVYDGNLLQVDRLGLTDAQIISGISNNDPVTYTTGGASAAAQGCRMAVEIFKPRDVKTNEFYELTDRIPVDGSGNPLITTFSRIPGQNYRPPSNLSTVTPAEDQIIMIYNEPLNIINFANNRIDVTFDKSRAVLMNPEIASPTIGLASSVYMPKIHGTSGSTVINVNKDKIVTPDYTKVADNRGKSITELVDKKAIPRSSLIRFSNKYVQDTNINGLSAFDFADQYPLDSARGALTKMVSLGTRILAVHERATSIVYTEERMIKNANGADQLIASSEAIGYDQQLDGGYGSYHPESIRMIDNMVFGFDVYKGVVWRYTQEGQHPISDYGLKGSFRDRAQAILASKATTKVIGGIDPFNKEYLITFGGYTYAFNYVKNVWTTRYSFLPEMYGTIGNKLISFKDGGLWVHNEYSLHNNFYGVQYPSFIKLAVNPHPTKVKVGMGIQLGQEAISVNVDFLQVEITNGTQYSYIKADEFEKLENIFYAGILKDVNTPAATIPGLLALRQGDDMRGKSLYIQINDDSTSKNSFQMANLVYSVSEYSE